MVAVSVGQQHIIRRELRLVQRRFGVNKFLRRSIPGEVGVNLYNYALRVFQRKRSLLEPVDSHMAWRDFKISQ
jgi:hypothetical protein